MLSTLTRDVLDDLSYDDMPESLHLGYRLIWRGWFAAQDTENLIGKWLGWPEHWRDHPTTPFLVSLVGGRACGSYHPGEYWDVRPAEAQTAFTMHHVGTEEGRAHMAHARQDAKRALKQLITALHQGNRDAIPAVGSAVPFPGR